MASLASFKSSWPIDISIGWYASSSFHFFLGYKYAPFLRGLIVLACVFSIFMRALEQSIVQFSTVIVYERERKRKRTKNLLEVLNASRSHNRLTAILLSVNKGPTCEY